MSEEAPSSREAPTGEVEAVARQALAREIVNRHLEYMDGLARGQITMRVSNAIAAVEEALAASQEGDAAKLKVLEEALREAQAAITIFARCPAYGKYGGPFVIASASFEDMNDRSSAPREAYWHWDDFVAAKNALEAIDAALAQSGDRLND